MKMIILLTILFCSQLFAGPNMSFITSGLYKVEGVVEGRFFVINLETSNEQRILIRSMKGMVDGAQYAICLKVLRDCHLECEAKIIGKPLFITPDLDPKLMIPDSEGMYAQADKNQCP